MEYDEVKGKQEQQKIFLLEDMDDGEGNHMEKEVLDKEGIQDILQVDEQIEDVSSMEMNSHACCYLVNVLALEDSSILP